MNLVCSPALGLIRPQKDSTAATGLKHAVGITGTPGTGKKTVAPRVASRLSYSTLDLNQVAKVGSSYRSGEPFEVDTVALRKRIKALQTSKRVIYGHLLPEVFRVKELGFVAVMRCEPSVLKKRLIARGYDEEKLVANLEAELIGVLLDACLRSFGQSVVHEYDSTKTTPNELANAIVSDYTRRTRQRRSWIDWTFRYASSAKLRSLLSFGKTEPAST